MDESLAFGLEGRCLCPSVGVEEGSSILVYDY